MDATLHHATARRAVPTLALVPFVLLTFAITWSLTGLYVFAPEWTSARFGELTGRHPLWVLAVWGPAISAFLLIAILTGWDGVKGFLSRLLLWRAPLPWVLFVALGVPLVFAVGAMIKGAPILGGLEAGAGPLFGAMAFMVILGPIEEFGWRGLAQPLLQRLMAPLWAGLLIGATWGFWHLPAFHLAGTVQDGWDFWPFFVGNIALAVIVTPLLNASRGSLLWPMFFHWQLINPFWPDAQPYDIALFIAVAVVVVWANRDTILRREGAVTRVAGRAEA